MMEEASVMYKQQSLNLSSKDRYRCQLPEKLYFVPV